MSNESNDLDYYAALIAGFVFGFLTLLFLGIGGMRAEHALMATACFSLCLSLIPAPPQERRSWRACLLGFSFLAGALIMYWCLVHDATTTHWKGTSGLTKEEFVNLAWLWTLRAVGIYTIGSVIITVISRRIGETRQT